MFAGTKIEIDFDKVGVFGASGMARCARCRGFLVMALAYRRRRRSGSCGSVGPPDDSLPLPAMAAVARIALPVSKKWPLVRSASI